MSTMAGRNSEFCHCPFYLGIGPALDVDLSGDVKTTSSAGRLTIGGWR
jgi:Zn-finger protein